MAKEGCCIRLRLRSSLRISLPRYTTLHCQGKRKKSDTKRKRRVSIDTPSQWNVSGEWQFPLCVGRVWPLKWAWRGLISVLKSMFSVQDGCVRFQSTRRYEWTPVGLWFNGLYQPCLLKDLCLHSVCVSMLYRYVMHGRHPRVLRERRWNPFVSLVSPYEDRV